MEYIAIARNIKISPRKMRLVVDSVKKQNVKAALSALSLMNKRAAGPVKKALDSAVANATNNFKANKEVLTIKDIIVTDGLALKRFHFAARGRTRPYKRRQSHVRVVLTDGTAVIKPAAVEKIEAKKEEKSEKVTKTGGKK